MIPAHSDKIPSQTLGGQLQTTYITDKHQNPQCFFVMVHNSMAYQHCDGTQQYGTPAL
jgi:hypothetical protein